MVKTILMDTLILFLLVYALMDILTRLTRFCSFRLLKKKVPRGDYVLLLSANQTPIEHTIRSVLAYAEEIVGNIILVDDGITEEERTIAGLFCDEFSNLWLMEREEYIRYLRRKTKARTEESAAVINDSSAEH